MKFLAYLKDKKTYLFCMGIGLCILESYLYIFNVNVFLKLVAALIILGSTLVPLGTEYLQKVSFYRHLAIGVRDLDKKYLFTEIINRPSFLEGQIFFDTAVEVNHNMCDEINMYKQNIRQYKEYIAMWVHEVKTPVATARLIGENNPGQVTKSIEEELEKIEGFIEQVLYYSKIDTVEQDYKITEYLLKDIVHKAIIENKKVLIGNKIKLDLHDLDYKVHTDAKWMGFILNQIITNSVKYGKEEGATLEIYAKEGHAKLQLFIKDNGIGIKPEEIKKVFQKGFVGTNGRRTEASTGMGLYICKKLMEKMHHGLSITSVLGEETTVICIFPTDSYVMSK
nr:sensor histidine kinase [uncultured Cellulosilyticum sp.]